MEKHPRIPGPALPLPDGREAMQGDHGAFLRINGGELLRDAIMIGTENLPLALTPLIVTQMVVSVDNRLIRLTRDGGCVTRRPVTVDDEAGVNLLNQGCAQCRVQAPRDPGNADIPGNVPRTIRRRHAEITQSLRDALPRMVTDENERHVSRRGVKDERRGRVIRQKGC